jgi:hypothetical protein
MDFIDRYDELDRLDRLMATGNAGFAVIYGRRRLGKTRLLLEWVSAHGGLYSVADQSTADVQRRYFAQAASERIPGFAEVDYPDWRTLLARLAREASATGFTGPIVFDEFPYLAASAPELPSVLQAFVDHDARTARLVIAIAGSSQRMMQGLALAGDAPLYGRAQAVLEIRPLGAEYLSSALGVSVEDAVEHFAAWGGVPRYWELAAAERGTVASRVERLVLDPLGPLHREPDRLLLEELPPAVELRPVLDAIGGGAHKLTEIAGRIGRPATSLSRPLERLTRMGLVRRDTPFGEPPRSSKRSLYRIDDPLFRLWFRVVASHRAELVRSDRPARRRLLARLWPGLVAAAWEDLCRARVPHLGDWGSSASFWRANDPEWDIVAQSIDGRRLLLGEAKWSEREMSSAALARWARELISKRPPALGALARYELTRALFVPRLAAGARRPEGVIVLTAKDLLALPRD